MPTQRHRPLAHSALALTAGAAEPDAIQLTAAFDTLCESLTAQLQPLFGAVAVDALFARAVNLANKEYPWLPALSLESGHHCELEAVAAIAAKLPAQDLHAGLAAVLAYDIDLLIAFVGEDLVIPLVRRAWPAVASDVKVK